MAAQHTTSRGISAFYDSGVLKSQNNFALEMAKDFVQCHNFAEFSSEQEYADTYLAELNQNINAFMAIDKSVFKGAWTPTKFLPMAVLSLFLRTRFHIANVATIHTKNVLSLNKKKQTLLRYYDEDRGVWNDLSADLSRLMKLFQLEFPKGYLELIEADLYDYADILLMTDNPHLAAVGNGIFNEETGELIPYSPKYVFTTRIDVAYNPNPTLPHYTLLDGSDMTPESLIRGFVNTDEEARLIWQYFHACMFPLKRYDMCGFFYSSPGDSGKGTLLKCLTSIIGEQNCTSISLSRMMSDAYLEGLENKRAILCGENKVGGYLDDCENFKNICSHDLVIVNRKYEKAIDMTPDVFMIQCVNDLPTVRDRSNSFFRRLSFVPFANCYTGCKDSRVKDVFVQDEAFKEYVLWKTLNTPTPNNEFVVPESCRLIIDEIKDTSSPYRQFAKDVVMNLSVDCMSWDLLRELYKSYHKENISQVKDPSGSLTFRREMKNLIDAGEVPGWLYKDSIRVGSRQDVPKYMFQTYPISKTVNPVYTGSNIDKTYTILCEKSTISGIVRDKNAPRPTSPATATPVPAVFSATPQDSPIAVDVEV